MELLIEIDFDSGTRRYSRVGIRTPDAYYEPRITAFGGIRREVSVLPGDYRASSVSLTLNNADAEFSRLRTSESWRNRRLLVSLIDLETGVVETVFEGRIQGWSLDKQNCSIEAVDWIQFRLQRPLLGVIDTDFYTNLPDATLRALIPIVIGPVDSPMGAVPAYLVDPNVGVTGWRYVMAQGRVPAPDQVYAFGVLKTITTHYTIAYAAGPNGLTCTYIDFIADPRTGNGDDEPHIAWNGSGITDDQTETGNEITNGADQLALFLRLNGFAANDLDASTITEAASRLSAGSVVGGFAAVDREQTVGDVVTKFAESFNIQVFTTRSGKIGMAVPEVTTSTQTQYPEVTALEDVVLDSYGASGANDLASTLVADYKPNFFAGNFTAQKITADSRQLTALGEEVILGREFPYIRDANSLAAVVNIKMFFLREQRQVARVIVPPHWYQNLDIGDTIKLTHFAAPSDDESQEPESHGTSNLVALWRFDEGSGQDLLDTSGQANDGELGSTSGADSDDPAWVAEGLQFDGSDDHVRAPFLVDPNADDFTVFAIFRASNSGSRRVILAQKNGTGFGRVWLEIDESNFLSTSIGGSANAHSTALEAGKWYAATVRKFGSTISLFLEGGDKEDFTETSEASDGAMLIGKGTVDPLHLQGILGTNLAAWFRFDEGSGDALTDYTGNGLDGQLGSAAGADANDPDWVAEGLSFVRANNDRVVCPTILSPSATDFTVFVAFKTNNASALQRVLCAEAGGTGTTRTWMFLDTDHKLATVIGGAVSKHTTALTDATWYVGCLRKTGTTLSIFIDGGSKQNFTQTAEAADGSFYIGLFPTGTLGYNDEMALLAIYDASLTDQQVTDNSTALAQILDDRINAIAPSFDAFFNDRIGLVAAYDDAVSDTQIAGNTLSFKRIVNAKVVTGGLYRVIGGNLVDLNPSLAAELQVVDLKAEPVIDLAVPTPPESLAFIDGKSSLAASLSGEWLLNAAGIAGKSTVTASGLDGFITDGLQHLWPFQDGSGTTLTDVVGSAHGTLGGQGGGASNRPSWVTEGLQFDGSDDWVTIPFFQDPSNGSWTVMIVFRSEANTKTILSQVGSLNREDWLAHTSGGSFASGLPDPALNDGGITTGQWYAGFVRRDFGTNNLRLNLIRTGSAQTNSVNDTVTQVVDGFHVLGFSSFEFPSSEFGFPFNGKMALMAHYNRRLSDTEVTAMFNAAKTSLAGRSISL